MCAIDDKNGNYCSVSISLSVTTYVAVNLITSPGPMTSQLALTNASVVSPAGALSVKSASLLGPLKTPLPLCTSATVTPVIGTLPELVT